MLRRVSSLGSEGWNEEDLVPMAEADDFMEEGDEAAVDFDEIFKSDSIGGRNSTAGDDATMVAMAAAAVENNAGMVTFNTTRSASSGRSVLNEDDMGSELKTSDREMGWWSGKGMRG